MKSIKPGRNSSRVGTVACIIVSIFGVFWCIVVCAIGGWFMLPFGILFVAFGIYLAVVNHRNATSPNRYSAFDIVDGDEEPDPLNEKYGQKKKPVQPAPNDGNGGAPGTSVSYCPFCGNPVDGKFDFCPKCGKQLPD